MRTVALVGFDGFQLLDLAGPVEVLYAANELGADPPYQTVLVSPDGRSARSESGVPLAFETSLAGLIERTDPAGDPLHTLAVVGGIGSRQVAKDTDTLADLVTLSRRADRTVSVCTGALILAAAGLLDGRRATTHWANCDKLARDNPEVEVLADQIYVEDGDRWTSAGVTAGIDLFLALVERDHGRELAHQIAGWLVVFARRPGGQAQFSVQLASEPARSEPIDRVRRWLADNLHRGLTVEAMAHEAAMSPRSFARSFKEQTGVTPAVYLERLRVEAAQRLLTTSELNVATVGSKVGFTRPETFHRAFTRQLNTTPATYRAHFGR